MSTIRDVARVAGVSTATVSRAINSPEKVGLKTRRNVFRAMKVCSYKYNALARGFATNRSNTLGVILPTITNPIFAESTRGIHDFADDRGFQVILGNSDYKYEKEVKMVEVLRERRVEGLIITTTNIKGEILKSLLDDDFPFVLLYSTLRRGKMYTVGVDNFLGGYRATEHLIHQHHCRVAMLAGGFSFSDRSFHRWHGYKKCLKDHCIPYDPNIVSQTEYSLSNGLKGIKLLLSMKNPPTAVFCSNDYLALGAMEGARELGLKLPEDLSIVGFDDMEMSSFVTPRLTTINQPAYEMGKIGADVLLNQIGNKSHRPVHKILKTNLVIRESTTIAPSKKQERSGMKDMTVY